MEAAVGPGVLEEPVAVTVHLSRFGQVLDPALLEIIFVNEVLPGVVRGVDIDALDLVEVGLAISFQQSLEFSSQESESRRRNKNILEYCKIYV